MSDPSRYYGGLLARWDHAKWLQDRLGEARAANAALTAKCERLQKQLDAAMTAAEHAIETGQTATHGWEVERAERERLRAALKGVGNAYGCYAGCTGALPGAPADGSGHTPACRAGRAALGEADDE